MKQIDQRGDSYAGFLREPVKCPAPLFHEFFDSCDCVHVVVLLKFIFVIVCFGDPVLFRQ